MAGIVKPTDQADPTFICPISADVMVDPVHLKVGECVQHIFERNNLLTYIKYREEGGHKDLQCPICKAKFTKADIETDTELAKQIQNWRKKTGLIAPSPPPISKPDPKDAKKEKLAKEREDEKIAHQVSQQINPHPYQYQNFSPSSSHHHHSNLLSVVSKDEADIALALQLIQEQQHSPHQKKDPLCEFLKEIYYECISPIIDFFLWLFRIEIKKNG
jgi:hypothetical protein